MNHIKEKRRKEKLNKSQKIHLRIERIVEFHHNFTQDKAHFCGLPNGFTQNSQNQNLWSSTIHSDAYYIFVCFISIDCI